MFDDEAVPSFDEPSQEAAYWRTKAQDLQDMLRIAQDSLDEFEQHSKELEDEMERELAQSAKKLEESNIKIEKLTQDKDDWKKKYQSSLLEHNKTLNEMTKEISQLTESRNIYKNKLRDIEMDNDELENAERMIRSSLADIENRYNQQMERTALMEEELLEKNQLQEDNQRLRDEIREMGEELAVLRDREFSAAETRTSTPAERAPSQAEQGGLTLKDLTNKRPPSSTGRPPSQASAGSQKDRPPSALGLTRSPSSANATLPPSRSVYALRTPMGPRTSLTHARKGSRDVRGDMAMTPSTGSPTARDRQQLASSRTTRTPRTPGAPRVSARPGQAGSSMRMMRDLNASMAALRNRINNAVTAQPGATYGGDHAGDQSGSGLDRSAIPRPSSRLATSMSTAHGSPLGSSTATVTGKTPRPSFDGKSSIPVASASLARSGRRPSSRLSVGPTAAAAAVAVTAATATAPSDFATNEPTPSGRTSRAQGHERASSAAGHIRSTTPLDFLNSEPPPPGGGRPSSRSSFVPRDSLLTRRRSSVSNGTSDEPDQAPASSAASTRIAGIDPKREPFTPTSSRRRGTTISASTATPAASSSTARRVREGTPAAGGSSTVDTAASALRRKTTHRPASSSGGSQSTSTAPSSSVAAYRESRLNHLLNVAHNGNGTSSGTERVRPSSALGGEISGPPPVPSSWKVRGTGAEAGAAGKVSSRRNSGTWTLKHSQSRSGSGSHSRSSSISGES